MAGTKRNMILSKRKARHPGDMNQLVMVLWGAIREAEGILYSAADDDVDTRLRAIHAITQACSVYARLLEGGELVKRLEALEAALHGQAA